MTPSHETLAIPSTLSDKGRASLAKRAMRRCWTMTAAAIAVTGAVVITACAPVPTIPGPATTPAPGSAPASANGAAAPAPPPQQTLGGWLDAPLASGTWTYRADGAVSRALFGPVNGTTRVTVACEKSAKRIRIWRALPSGTRAPTAMTVATSSATRTLPVSVENAPTPMLVATLAATDPIIDAMIFSRGRFALAASGTELMVMPSWAEVARVAQDCRG